MFFIHARAEFLFFFSFRIFGRENITRQNLMPSLTLMISSRILFSWRLVKILSGIRVNSIRVTRNPCLPLWHPARTMCLLLTRRNDDKRKVTDITCANMLHLNYLPRSSGGFNRPRCVLDSSQMHHLTPTRTRATGIRLPPSPRPTRFSRPHPSRGRKNPLCS